MALNRKLSPILHGRRIAKSEASAGQLSVSFSDGSCLRVRLAEPAQPPGSGSIEKVLERGSRFVLVLAGGSQAEMTLADPGSSVSLRDGQGKVEYLG